MKELLITIDGHKAHDLETVWVIRNPIKYGQPEELKLLDNVFDLYKDKGYLFFSSKEHAEKYIASLKQPQMVTFAPSPIPIIVDGIGPCYLVYVTSNPIWENDEACVAAMEGGQWYHVTTDRIKSWNNQTYGIEKK